MKHPPALLLCCACLLGMDTGLGAPVTGPWTLATGTAVLTNTNTASPMWGDGTVDNADASSIYSAFPLISLTNAGDKIVLTGSMTLFGVTTGGENLRFGIFNENSTGSTNGWLGYFLRNGNGTTVASVMERATGNTAHFTSTTGAANVGTAPVAGSVVGPSSDTYNFTISFERNGTNGLIINTMLKRITDNVDFGAVTAVVDASPQTFAFNRLGFQATTGLNADKLQMTNVDVAFVPAITPNPRVINLGFGNGFFFVQAVGLDPNQTYLLKRSADMLAFPTTVDTFRGDVEYIFIDGTPPTGRAFYRLERTP